jgi:phosphate:Na+ symporter
MAVTLTAAAMGYIDFPTACAMALGQNIGTTITAALAAIGAPLVARRAALAHVLFNFLGAIWPMFIFKPFVALVDAIVPGNPYGVGEDVLLVAIPTHIAAFHTMFNLANTMIFLPITGPFEKLIVRLMPATAEEGEDENEHELLYLTTPFSATPELAISAAQREVDRMAGVTIKMLARIRQAFEAEPAEKPRLFEKIRNHENATDVLEHKINEYLARLVHAQLSSTASKETLSLMSMINDLERIGDHGEKVALLLARMLEEDRSFTAAGLAALEEMAEATDENLRYMRGLILKRPEDLMTEARRLEDLLNGLRDRFRQEHLQRLMASECDPTNGVIFTDLLTSFEKMGDHSFNVAESAAGIK